MTLYLSNRDGDGKTSEEGHYKFQTAVWDGSVIEDTALQVVQTSPASMNVRVLQGQFKIDTALNYSYTGWNSTDAVLAISTADAANPRITTVVAYVDKTELTSPSPPNNPGIVKLAAVNGTPSAVPTAPSPTTIQSQVGAGNPYIVLADIQVNKAVLNISNSVITDRRELITLASEVFTNSSAMTSYSARQVPSQKAVKEYVDFNYTAELEMTDFNNPAFLKPRKWEIPGTAMINAIANRPPGAVAGHGETICLNTGGVINGVAYTYALQHWYNYTGEKWTRAVDTNGSGVIRYGQWYQYASRFDNDWIAPSLQNGWVKYDTTYSPPGYYKDNAGIVHLRGMMKTGTNGNLFVLPAGYRPSFRILTHSICSPNNFYRLDISPNGQVLAGTGYSNAWISIENISFKAEV